MSEEEDEYAWLRDSPPRGLEQTPDEKPTRRGKLLSLDDLLADSAKEKKRKLERAAKQSKVFNSESSSDDEIAEAASIRTIIQTCEKEVMSDEDSQGISKWGERIFGRQRTSTNMVISSTGSSIINAALSAAQTLSLRSESDLFPDDGESMALELLTGNWLFPFIKCCGHADSELSKWAFYKLAYSREKNIERAALEFLSHSFTLEAQGSDHRDGIAWVPSLKLMLEALYIYGYMDTCRDLSSIENFDNQHKDVLEEDGPPRNLISLLQFITRCSETRQWRKVISILDLESLVFAISRLWLDRSILFLSSSIGECVGALISQFTQDEWASSCDRLASLISRISQHKVNILRILRCLCGEHARLKSLRKAVATKLLLESSNFKESPSSLVDVIMSFSNLDLKSDKLDFFDLYYHIVLVDICLSSSDLSLIEHKCAMGLWLSFLKCCSIRISSSCPMPYATKVRNRASYLWHNYSNCHHEQAKDQLVLGEAEFSLESERRESLDQTK